jgi:hypothetical protein
MINSTMRLYDYYTFGDDDGYGMPALSTEPKGKIKMSISITSQSIQDNILYKDCSYVGLTHDAAIDDSYIIQYGEEKLKVLYINPEGRYKIVFLKGM